MHTLVQKRGAEIVRSLTTEGYRLINRDPESNYYFLRHPNGNLMHVLVKLNEVIVFKNGIICKKELVTLR